jgi:hypothetical protein
MKHTRAEADFLFGKALIEHQLGPIASQGEAHFHAALVSHHPPYGELSANALRDIYKDLDHLVRERRNQLITRKELEQAMRKRLPANSGLEVPAVRMYTGSSTDDAGVDRTELFFDWAEFFGGQERSFPGPQRWNEVLLGQLGATKKWVLDNRSTRRIHLVGNRRLSASLAIGAVFSAVAGFSLEMVGRGERIWATDAYPRNDTPDYPLAITDTSSTVPGERMVVCISVGVKQDTCGEVLEFLRRAGLSDLPVLAVHGTGGIESAEQVNRVVDEIKSAISAALNRSGACEIVLFFAGPAQLALFLGQRLYATAAVQCYEWVATNSYVPTCKLR